MRNRALHDALRDFALEAAARLVRATDGGAEIEFALDERTDGGATLYRYRPLTAEFIGARWIELRTLPAFDTAARTLGSGARSYLRRRGEPGADAEPALRMMVERLYEDSTSFVFPEERFERVYDGVERALYAGTVHATVVAAVLGLRLESARIDLGGELALVDVALLAPAPSPAWLDREEACETEAPVTAYLVLERDLPSDAPLPLGEARVRFRAALMALRMLDPGAVALAPLGFSRAGEGRWQPVLLGPSGRGRGPERVLASDDAEELRELLDGLEAGSSHGPLAWALDRFEMGLEREADVEALTDYLLCLRVLLAAGRDAEPATVALRLAALCAEEGDRRVVQRRIESAFALEPFVIEGGLGAARGERYVEAVGRHGPQVLIHELEDALRHLLGGVLREELEPDLAGRADGILLRTGEPIEIRARRLQGVEADEEVASPMDGEGDLEGERDFEPDGGRASATEAPADAEPQAAREPEPELRRAPRPLALARRPSRAAGRPVVDSEGAETGPAAAGPSEHLALDPDEESESYSAPV